MSLEAKISVELKLGESNYGVTLSIPSSTPTADTPFLFNFNLLKQNTATPPVLVPDQTLTEVAVGGSDNVYVAVSPPSSIMDLTGGIVSNLDVIVNSGGFNPDTDKFGGDSSS